MEKLRVGDRVRVIRDVSPTNNRLGQSGRVAYILHEGKTQWPIVVHFVAPRDGTTTKRYAPDELVVIPRGTWLRNTAAPLRTWLHQLLEPYTRFPSTTTERIHLGKA
jgi:hypothetical protein